MLVLTRKDGEKIKITCADGTEITVHTVRVEPHRVHIGIEAPDNVNILRDDAVIKEEKSGDRQNR
jgi:carbon storage regulator CsrA